MSCRDGKLYLVHKSQLYGLPARVVRDFLRRIALRMFDEDYLRDHLKIDEAAAKKMAAAMPAYGLIEFEGSGEVNPIYRIAPGGGQLAAARFAPQIAHIAYFSPSWTAFQADRGRHFSVIVDGVSV